MASKKSYITIAVLSLSFVASSGGALNPAIADITMAFPDIAPSTIMLLATMSSLLSVPSSLVSGFITPRYVSYRTMVILAILIMAATGVIPFFMEDFYVILAVRSLFGIATGLLMPLSLGIVFSLFKGPEVSNLLGYSSLVINLGGVVYQMAGGILCTVSWQHTFLVYISLFALAGIVFAWLPNPPKAPAQPDRVKKSGLKIPPAVWGMGLGMGGLILIIMPINLNMSLIVLNDGLGNAATAGFLLMMYTMGGLLSGIVFGKVYEKLRKYTIPVAFLIASTGLLLLITGKNVPLLTAGCVLAGFGISLSIPAMQTIAGSLMPSGESSMAFSIMNSIGGIMGFGAMFFYEGLMKLVNTVWLRFPMLFGLTMLVTFNIVFAIIAFRGGKGTGPGTELETGKKAG